MEALGVEFERITEPIVEELDIYLEKMLSRLVEYRERYGHVGVTPTRDRALHTWIANQRSYRVTGTLKAYRLRRMDEMGFPWKPVDYRWEEKCVLLSKYKTRFGHTLVPVRWSEDMSLGRWVAHQRELFRAGHLPEERREFLNSMGFQWGVRKEKVPKQTRGNRAMTSVPLHVRIERLKMYQQRFGNPRVPARWPEDVSLGRWVAHQRELFRQGRMPEERWRMLDDVGFQWEVRKHG